MDLNSMARIIELLLAVSDRGTIRAGLGALAATMTWFACWWAYGHLRLDVPESAVMIKVASVGVGFVVAKITGVLDLRWRLLEIRADARVRREEANLEFERSIRRDQLAA